MAKTLVQINFNYDGSKTEYLAMAQRAAEPIAGLAGLVWKIWLVNEAEQEAGGWYLFETGEAAQNYLQGPIVTHLKNSPRLANLSIKLFNPAEPLTEITRGPVRLASLA